MHHQKDGWNPTNSMRCLNHRFQLFFFGFRWPIHPSFGGDGHPVPSLESQEALVVCVQKTRDHASGTARAESDGQNYQVGWHIAGWWGWAAGVQTRRWDVAATDVQGSWTSSTPTGGAANRYAALLTWRISIVARECTKWGNPRTRGSWTFAGFPLWYPWWPPLDLQAAQHLRPATCDLSNVRKTSPKLPAGYGELVHLWNIMKSW